MHPSVGGQGGGLWGCDEAVRVEREVPPSRV